MPALFCIVGMIDPAREDRFGVARVWPVAYRVTPEDAAQVVKVCERQQAEFLRELMPIWETITKALQRGIHSKMGYEERRRADEKRRARLQSAKEREAAICARFANEMLDPLFPSATNGSEPYTVVYKVLEFWDDPREMGIAALMLKRAELHGLATDDDETVDDE